jgi:hypothetical protein
MKTRYYVIKRAGEYIILTEEQYILHLLGKL